MPYVNLLLLRKKIHIGVQQTDITVEMRGGKKSLHMRNEILQEHTYLKELWLLLSMQETASACRVILGERRGKEQKAKETAATNTRNYNHLGRLVIASNTINF